MFHKHDGSDDEVQPTGAEALVVEGAILDHTAAVETHRAAQFDAVDDWLAAAWRKPNCSISGSTSHTVVNARAKPVQQYGRGGVAPAQDELGERAQRRAFRSHVLMPGFMARSRRERRQAR